MRPATLASFTFSFVLPALAFSQSTQLPPEPSYTQVAHAGESSCPIELSAERRSATQLVSIGVAVPHRAGQGLHLSLTHRGGGIRSAEVVVHAASTKARVLPVGGSEGLFLDRNFQLTAQDDLRESNLWMEGAGSILSIDLVSITFSDGSAWKASSDRICHAVPRSLLLIGSR